MKFVLRKTQSSVRKGCLSSFKRLPQGTVETPACMLFTRCGSVPHLSLDVLNKIDNLPLIVAMSMSTLSDYHDVVRECKEGLAQFTSMKDRVILCTSHDVSQPLVKFNCSSKKAMTVRNRSGNKLFSPQEFVKVQEAVKCDMVQVLGDYEANDTLVTTPSRMNKAYHRTVDFLNKVLDLSQDSDIEGTPLLASLEGGLLMEPRTRCAKESSVSPNVSGFILEGFHSYSHKSEIFWDEPSRLTVLRSTLSYLPEDRVRILNGALHPLAVLTLIKEGIDLFDTSYTYQVTERGGALCFPYIDAVKSFPSPDRMFELNLTDVKYADQFVPIIEHCQCHTCRSFTRGYIHHLLKTREMLAGVLLSVHNIHHYLLFFEHVRQALDSKEQEPLNYLRKLIGESKGLDIAYPEDTTLDTASDTTSEKAPAE